MKIFLLLFLIISLPFASAQELSLQQCIDVALKNNFNLLIQENNLDKAEYDTWKSYQGVIPTVNISGQGGTYKTGPSIYVGESLVGIDSVTGGSIFDQVEISRPAVSRRYNSLALSVNWTIFDGMATYYTVKGSQLNEEATRYDLQSKINSTIQQVRSGYFEVLKYQKLVEARQLAVERSIEQLKKQVLAFQIGSATRLDTLKAHVTYNTDRIALITGKNGFKTSVYNLNVILGQDPTKNFKVKDIDEKQIPVLDSFTTLSELAMKKNPDLLAGQARLGASDYNRKYNYSPYIPRISLVYRYSRDHENYRKVFLSDFDKNWSYNLGWSVNWNLFNGFGDYINYQKSKIDQNNAQIQYKQSSDNLLKNLRVAYDNYKDALEIIDINKVNLESAKEDYRLASEKKSVGSATILEVIDSQVSLSRAEQTLVEAYYSALKARAQIDELVGTQYQLVTENN